MLVDWMMAVLRFAAVASVCPRVVPRDDWGARTPKKVQEMYNPVSTVVIHHTYSPAACYSAEECCAAMRSMQNFHMNVRGWDDFGYSFAVGGDGRVYKGRGWNRVGAHSPPYNFDSIGITLIGDWQAESPPERMLETTKWLIQCGVETGRIAVDYQVVGHRQARNTDCPGDALYAAIQKWDRWTDKPAPPRHTAPAAPSEQAVAANNLATMTASRVARAGIYDPATPVAGRDDVEVRQLNKRSLWDRLVHIWDKEAARRALEQQHSLHGEGEDDAAS